MQTEEGELLNPRCLEHLAAVDALEGSMENYVVSSILYYRFDCAYMADHAYDSACGYLLTNQAWTRWGFLDKEALRAGSGYCYNEFPKAFHDYVDRCMGVNR